MGQVYNKSSMGPAQMPVSQGTHPGLHFHGLVQENSGEGDGVDGHSKSEDIHIRVLVSL